MIRFADMKMKPKLIGLFLIMSLLPVFLTALLAYYNSSHSIHQQAFDHLKAVRDIKKNALQQYVQTIQDQVITLSEDQMIVNAMKEFSQYFKTVKKDNKLSAKDIESMKISLQSYYTNDFLVEYQKQNEESTPNVDSIFQQLDEESIILQNYYIAENENLLGSKHLLDQSGDASKYSRLHNQFHPILRNFLEKFGYYDIFLVDSVTGDIVYSVFKELDFSTSLLDGPYAQTNFGDAFRRANAAKKKEDAVLVDFKQYIPSYNAAASFIASPIYDGEEKIGVLMFQMPIDRLNTIMNERSGMGKTGETYLVGPDNLMRSDSYLETEFHTVAASFRNQEKGKVDTAATQSVFLGESGEKIITDYNGNLVLSAFAPLEFADISWAILAEIDQEEAFSTLSIWNQYVNKPGLLGTISVLTLIVSILVIIIAFIIAKTIANPITGMKNMLQDIAQGEGDLTKALIVTGKDEVGEAAKWFNVFIEKLNLLIVQVKQSAGQVASGSTQLSSASQELANATTEQAASLEETSASIEELSATISHNASSAREAAQIVSDANALSLSALTTAKNGVTVVEKMTKIMNQITESSKEIATVTTIINEIADQTNLLALNAAIEAARAGDAGKGFAVVADEVRKLAERSQIAAKEIAVKIQESIELVHDGNRSAVESNDGLIKIQDGTQKVSEVLENARQLVHKISNACDEQSVGVQQITEAIVQLDQVTQQNSSTSEQSATASDVLSTQAHTLFQLMSQFKSKDIQMNEETHVVDSNLSEEQSDPMSLNQPVYQRYSTAMAFREV